MEVETQTYPYVNVGPPDLGMGRRWRVVFAPGDEVPFDVGKVHVGLAQRLTEAGWTHNHIAVTFGTTRAAVSNALRREAAREVRPTDRAYAATLPFQLDDEALNSYYGQGMLRWLRANEGEILTGPEKAEHDEFMTSLERPEEGEPLGRVITFKDGRFHFRPRREDDYPEPFYRD